ncbi:MAG: hypothetical protein A2014_03360 [Spirochaetes bacterium GWF1_49_6]|nr:MAG: hypothetical protein A2014_03360 [Spirochaetes bacterium GWF1_49_6]
MEIVLSHVLDLIESCRVTQMMCFLVEQHLLRFLVHYRKAELLKKVESHLLQFVYRTFLPPDNNNLT